jgi:hypothetical protein
MTTMAPTQSRVLRILSSLIRCITIVSVLQDALTEKVFEDITHIKFTVLLQLLKESEVDVAAKKLVDSIVFQTITNLRVKNNLVSLTHTLHVACLRRHDEHPTSDFI